MHGNQRIVSYYTIHYFFLKWIGFSTLKRVNKILRKYKYVVAVDDDVDDVVADEDDDDVDDDVAVVLCSRLDIAQVSLFHLIMTYGSR